MLDYKKNGKKGKANSSERRVKEYKLVEQRILTVNPGDRIAKQPQTIEEKSKQLAVDAPDVTGDWIEVPTYFIVEYPNGEKKALHHVRDAKAISDVIRQARFEDEDWKELDHQSHNLNLTAFVFILALFLLTVPILIGIF